MRLVRPQSPLGRLYFVVRASVDALAKAGVSALPDTTVLLQLEAPRETAVPALPGRAARVIPYPESFIALTVLALTSNSDNAAPGVEVLLPRSVFDRIAEHIGAGKMESLTLSHDNASGDPILEHLGASLAEAIKTTEGADEVLIKELTFALGLHVTQRFGRIDAPPSSVRGGLSPWQLRLARRRLDQHVEGDLKIDELAAECGLSSSHFARAFTASTGVPPYRWLLQRRIECAKGLILGGEISLAEVAVACGFADQSHFTRAFSTLVGLPPARWRVVQGAVSE